jgi:hypothetical protein
LTRFSLPNQNIENNPMQSNKGSLAGMLYPRKHFDTSGKSPALFQHRATFKPLMALPNGLFGAITGQKSRPLKLYRLATANDRLRVAVPRALALRVPEEIST